jgi:DNA-binding transcriptional LysR family regulator
MRLDPLSLKLFVAVMEEGTIADAAARAHIAASAASRRIRELESVLGTPLFARSNRGAEATPAAFELLDRARAVLADLDDIARQMAAHSRGARGQVRITANISAITQFLPAQLQSFAQAHPGVQVHLQERISSDIARAVADNAADVGILNPVRWGPQLAFLPYRRDELVVVAPAGHALARRRAVTMAEALDHDFVGAHPGSAINNRLVQAAGEAGKPLRLRIQVTSYDAMCLMVAAGLGIGVMPRGSARLYLRPLKIRAVALDEPWAVRMLALCLRADGVLPPAARLLVEHLQRDDGA